jgi:hypothetical protein
VEEVLKALGACHASETEELFELHFAWTEEAWALEEAIGRVLSRAGPREAALRAVPRLLGDRECEELVRYLAEASADGTSSERHVASESLVWLLETKKLSESAAGTARRSLREFLRVSLPGPSEVESLDEDELVGALREAWELE